MAVIAICLCGCSASANTPSPADLDRAQSARPHDQRLAERYERSCMTCHAIAASGAPLTGFAPHWENRLAKGMDQLLAHTVNGFNAMPPRGQCNDCSPEDLRALTQFMSTKGAR